MLVNRIDKKNCSLIILDVLPIMKEVMIRSTVFVHSCFKHHDCMSHHHQLGFPLTGKSGI